MSLTDTIVYECTNSSLVSNEAPTRKFKRDVDKNENIIKVW